MAHFAKLDVDNNVIDVVVVNNDVLGSPESEATGITFLTNLTGHSSWKQCSYNRKIRKNYLVLYRELKKILLKERIQLELMQLL